MLPPRRRFGERDPHLAKLRALVSETHAAWCAAVKEMTQYERLHYSAPLTLIKPSKLCRNCGKSLPEKREYCNLNCRLASKEAQDRQFARSG